MWRYVNELVRIATNDIGIKKPARMRVLGRSRTVANYVMAEKEGFEPSIRDKPYTPLAGERLQPLGHFSISIFISLY